MKKIKIFQLVVIIYILCFFLIPVVAAEDTTPPELVDFSFAPATVDITNSFQNISFTVHVTDDVTGVQSITVTAKSPSGSFGCGDSISEAYIISGDSLDGIFGPAECTINQYYETGIWHIERITISDFAFNSMVRASP